MNTTQNKTQQVQAVHQNEDINWWRGAVIYQIYPRSFQDSNGDGIGDLRGIVERLPYVASLGVDAIWISPFFLSPMKDFGYDVSDYRDVDPIFGTLQDFDAVLEKAHQFGIRVIIDQVLSHSSDQHAWFVESRLNKHNPKSDWYVWSDPKPDGTPPNNWLSIFGGSAWHWDSNREQYYLHNFLVSQPDLNFHNPEVRSQLLDDFRFWLDRGVDGFRLDTVNFYFADKELRDNPALAPELRNDTIATSVNPYNYQDHIYSKNQPENLAFLEDVRAVMNEYPGTTLLGEVGDAQRGLEIVGEYTQGNNRVHMCYSFELLSGDTLSAEQLKLVFDSYAAKAAHGWPCWAFTNHDVMRHSSRWNLTPESARLYTTLMMCLRGTLCLYQGEELGLAEVEIGFEDLQDPYGIEFWPEFKGRDGCRTPMVWDSTHPNGGFSDFKSWLPVPSQHLELNVQDQEHTPAALLHHYRRAIAFRQAHSVLVKGEQSKMMTNGDILMFTRSLGNEEVFCAFNLSGVEASFELPEGKWQQAALELGGSHITTDSKQQLRPWQSCIAVKTIVECSNV